MNLHTEFDPKLSAVGGSDLFFGGGGGVRGTDPLFTKRYEVKEKSFVLCGKHVRSCPCFKFTWI